MYTNANTRVGGRAPSGDLFRTTHEGLHVMVRLHQLRSLLWLCCAHGLEWFLNGGDVGDDVRPEDVQFLKARLQADLWRFDRRQGSIGRLVGHVKQRVTFRSGVVRAM
eukprot:GFYU01064136.1.p1 GENE.GFYU01064136.1~~GFYU01064136.1.p1  ORF type:complete len:108 (-),score=8.77 GFYU01064136.1:172-495(-)